MRILLVFLRKFRAFFNSLFARKRRFGTFKTQFKSFFAECFMNSYPERRWVSGGASCGDEW